MLRHALNFDVDYFPRMDITITVTTYIHSSQSAI